MSKRKTKQQKIIAKLRRELQFSAQTTAQVKPLPKIKTENNLKNQEKVSYDFKPTFQKIAFQQTPSHLISDLKKTLILTSSIVAVELILFFLMKSYLLPLSI